MSFYSSHGFGGCKAILQHRVLVMVMLAMHVETRHYDHVTDANKARVEHIKSLRMFCLFLCIHPRILKY